MVGERYGRLVVDHLHCHGGNGKKPLWACKCDCGGMAYVSRQDLLRGHTTSCGCYRLETQKDPTNKHHTHGMKKTRLYRIYNGMKNRCYNTKGREYPWYGGRGIILADEWLGENGFIHFKEWAFANGYQENLTIDRINVNGNYAPDNCRWVNWKVQENNRRNNVLVTINGTTKTFSEWCEFYGVPYGRAKSRYQKGFTIEDVFYKGKLNQGSIPRPRRKEVVNG